MPTSPRRNSICEVYFLVQSCRNCPAEFARCPRCPPGACQRRWLPFPVSVMLIFRCFLVQTVNLIFYGVCKLVEGFTREVYFLVQPCRNRPAEFARCSRCPPVVCQRRWLPLSVFAMLIFRRFPVQTVNLIFYGVLQAGGGVHPRSILSRAAMSKPSGGIRSFSSLSAWGLPTPVVAFSCFGNVDIQVLSGAGG